MIIIKETYGLFNQEVRVSSNLNPYINIKGLTIVYEDTETENNKFKKCIDLIELVAGFDSMKNNDCRHPAIGLISFGHVRACEKNSKTNGNYEFADNAIRILGKKLVDAANQLLNPKILVSEDYMRSIIFYFCTEMRKDSYKMYGIDYNSRVENLNPVMNFNVDAWFVNMIHTHLFKGFNIDDEIIDMQKTIESHKEALKETKDVSNPVLEQEREIEEETVEKGQEIVKIKNAKVSKRKLKAYRWNVLEALRG